MFGEIYNNSSNNGGYTTIFIDSTIAFNNPMSTKLAFDNGSFETKSFSIPIKKDFYFCVSTFYNYLNNIYWLPLVSEELTSTTNSVAETGGSGVNYEFPDGLSGLPLTWNLGLDNTYTVPAGKNLFITQYL